MGKKTVLIILIFACMLPLLLACERKSKTPTREESFEDYMAGFTLTESKQEVSNYILNEGCVRNESVAIDIASSVFNAVYGRNFSNGLPLLAKYNKESQEWFVRTQLPEGFDGGCKHIIIRARNAEIVAIWAEK